MKRWFFRLLILTGAVAGLLLLTATASWAQESCFVSKINAARSSNLTVRSDLTSIARRHSARMASSGTIYHNGNLANEAPGDWQSLGENVGMGPTCDDIHNAFMNSASHRKNILDPKFNFVGVGVVTASDGTLYVTEVFMEASQPAPSQPAPTNPSSGTAAPTRRTTTPTQRSTAPRRQPAPAPAPAAPAPAPPPPPPPPPGSKIKGNTLAMLDQMKFSAAIGPEIQTSYDTLIKEEAAEERRKEILALQEQRRRRGLFSKFATYIGAVLSGSV